MATSIASSPTPLASIIVQEASITKGRFEYIQWHLGRLLAHVREMPTTDEGASNLDPSTLLDATLDIIPPRPAARGRPRKFKGHAENKLHDDVRDTTTANGVASNLEPQSSLDLAVDAYPEKLITTGRPGTSDGSVEMT
ncbi:hypothetical protein J5N97_001266 [Dioscorea zingiberensis]|uniref:Uncharacterized protein n=1 Tax=Dioscorea zingiberensis TaxID=325984 RepID=A0A9D5BU27_9LILI|nr:hypothetical protein J5N97_001266 [Dioscorea zingiberensis]